MESYLFRPTFWERKKYNGNGSFANSSIFISCVAPLQNEVNTITMDGVFKVRTYKRTSTSQSWTITETTDQVYTSAWLTNAKNVDRKPNIHLGDGVSIDVTQYPDVVKMIFQINYINTSMFSLHPPDWTPPDDATGEFYALSDELPTFRYEAFVWYMGANGFPTNENIRDEAEYTEPIPLSQWTIKEGYNDGFPFNGLLRDIRHANIYPERRENVIRVYSRMEPQDGFTSNGLAILHPTSCISLHNDDRWDIKLKHPLDEWGKWKYLLVMNILKIDGQLFRIKRQKPYIDSSGGYIEVEAKHITSDLADECCKDSEFQGGTASDFIAWAKSNVMHWEDERYKDPYNFNISAAYDGTLSADTYPPATLLSLLVGLDNSLLNRMGGELYRDNFDISISPRMAYAKDNAFYLRYSLDMVEISQEVDYSDFCTLLYCYDNWGNWWAISYAGTIQWAIHHQITKIVKFNYSECDWDRFSADCDAAKAHYFTPKVTYKLKMASLRNDPKYAGFLDLQNYRYGDSGTIYCPELDIETVQKIVEVEEDKLTGEILSITLGNMQNSFTRPSYMGSTISSGYSVDDKNTAAMQKLLIGSNIASLQKFPINRLRTFRIKTLQGG